MESTLASLALPSCGGRDILSGLILALISHPA